MPAYEYGNTRLRGMKAKLFAPADLRELAGLDSIERLLNRLTKTTYSPAIEAALLQYEGLACLSAALRLDWIKIGGKIRTFYAGKAKAQVGWIFRRVDVNNVRAICRGVAGRRSPAQIMAAVEPIGDLTAAELAELAGLTDIGGVIAQLAVWDSPLAEPMMSVRSQYPGSLFAIEIALVNWYWTQMESLLGRRDAGLREIIRFEVDTQNLFTLYRLFVDPAVPAQIALSENGPPYLFIQGGEIPRARLQSAREQKNWQGALNYLADSGSNRLLNGIGKFDWQDDSAAGLERAVYARQLALANRLVIQDPLGIGMFWSYLILKQMEHVNLRVIGQGLLLGDPPEQIVGDLVFPN